MGSESLRWRPQVERDYASWMMGLKKIKNISGDSVPLEDSSANWEARP